MITMAFKNSLEMVQLAPKVHSKAFLEGDLNGISGEACFMLQPIHRGILAESLLAGGNSLGLSPADGNLVLVHTQFAWDDAKADAAANAAAENWLGDMKALSQLVGVSHPL